MFQTKRGLLEYLVLCDIQSREGFDYRTEKEIKQNFKEEVALRTENAIKTMEQFMFADDYKKVLTALKTMFNHIFLGFEIQNNIIKLWRIEL